jgi:hypothetical protein
VQTVEFGEKVSAKVKITNKTENDIPLDSLRVVVQSDV